MTRGRIVLFLLGVVALVAAYLFVAFSWSYSTGERAGWVQKLSRKGWLCKTWEGEIAMVAMPGAMPEKFYFTVLSDDVAAQINRLIGRRVALHYEEKVGLPTTCFGETRHYVTRVSPVDEVPPAPAMPPAIGSAAPREVLPAPAVPPPAAAPPASTPPAAAPVAAPADTPASK